MQPTPTNLSFCNLTDTGPPEPPTVYLWSLYLCAQHHNQVDNSMKALEMIDAAIDHTPTEVQLYMLKAKILKVSCVCVCVCVCFVCVFCVCVLCVCFVSVCLTPSACW